MIQEINEAVKTLEAISEQIESIKVDGFAENLHKSSARMHVDKAIECLKEL